ncbi:hypothetical protein Tco_0025684 [Tanacetum coccineum]
MVISTRNTSSGNISNKVEESMRDMFLRLQETVAQMNQSVQTLTAKIATVESGQTYLSNEVARFRNRERSSRQYLRMTKLEFSKFSGEDVKGWLFRCQQFFKVDNVSDEEKVKLASIHLFDKSLAWHKQFEKINEDLKEIKNLSQDGTVLDYQDKFEALVSRAELIESQDISCFVAGFQQEIGLMVKMFIPKSLYDAYQLARMQETMKAVNTKRYTPILSTPKHPVNTAYVNRSTTYHAKPPITQLALPSTPYNKLVNTMNTPQRRQLSQKEYEEKDLRIYEEIHENVEEVEEQVVEEVIEEPLVYPHISLNALIGMNGKDYGKVLSTTKAGLIVMSLCVYPTTLMTVYVEGKQVDPPNTTPTALDKLLEEFQDVFAVQYTLSPHRSHDHRIALQEGVPPVNVWPY